MASTACSAYSHSISETRDDFYADLPLNLADDSPYFIL